MLLRHQGVEERRRRIVVRLNETQQKQAGLTYLLSARIEDGGDGGTPWARIRPQGAGQLLHNVGADGWVVLPPGRGVFEIGEETEMELFQGSTFSAVFLTS
jgi:molybdopterin molybdotransferase